MLKLIPGKSSIKSKRVDVLQASTIPVTNHDVSVDQGRNRLSRIDLSNGVALNIVAWKGLRQKNPFVYLRVSLRHVFRIEEINFPKIDTNSSHALREFHDLKRMFYDSL